MSAKQLDFYFDIGSPYSYLAATQIEAVAERIGAEVRWRPFLLGGVFKAVGNEMPARVASKARYMLQDLNRWAKHYDVPFQFSSRFPINSLKAQRALVAASRVAGPASVGPFALALYRAYWVEDRDVADVDEVRRAAEAAGLPADEILAAAESQEVKDELRAITDEAVSRGAFGAPTICIGDDTYWGNDRLPLIESEHGPS